MRYCSTRGGVSGVTFEEAISRGYARDGGLFVPEALPKLSAEVLQQWRTLDFPSLAEAVFALFLDDELPAEDLRRVIRGSYANFSSPEIVPVVRVGDLHVAELFHGPTLCFKDLGQQPLVRLLAYFAAKRGVRRTMLVSTTGDTGPAAMRAVVDAASPNLSIMVFFPKGQVSDLQRRQMTTCSSAKARVATFEGGGDDMDLPLKRLGADQALAQEHSLCGINSYNLGRPVAQIAHYVWTYFRVLDQLQLPIGAAVDIAVPSGALGNLAAGVMARQMGVPIRRFVACVNANDITHRTFAKGEFHRSEQMEKTLSDAINIQVPYNMERVFYYLTGEQPALVASWMTEMDRSGKFTLPDQWLAKLQETFSSYRVDDDAMCATIRRALEEHRYLVDPHTAVALAGAWQARSRAPSDASAPLVPLAVLATASPSKFEAAIAAAVGAERWTQYFNSPQFPASARAVLAAEERPYGLLCSRGALADSQAAWEEEVRAGLAAVATPSGAGTIGSRARL